MMTTVFAAVVPMPGVLAMLAGVLPVAAINWHSVLFLLFAAVACACAVAVVVAENVVRMAFYLVLSLAATAGLFFLAGAEFVGAMQLMIYVGGTLVLLVFGVMLTAQAPFVAIKTSSGDRVLAGMVGAALLAVLLQAAFRVEPRRRRPLRSVWPCWACASMSPLLVLRRPPCGAATCCPSKSCRCICSWCSSVPHTWPARSGGGPRGRSTWQPLRSVPS
jgi:NADH:ubiquinone oxidoreductase subunit 6 (subunit J)